MFSPLETGTTWGWPRERGRSRETGLLAQVGPGARRAAPARPAARPGEAGHRPLLAGDRLLDPVIDGDRASRGSWLW